MASKAGRLAISSGKIAARWVFRRRHRAPVYSSPASVCAVFGAVSRCSLGAKLPAKKGSTQQHNAKRSDQQSNSHAALHAAHVEQ